MKRNTVPTAPVVSGFLGRRGFKRSRESSKNIPGGFYVSGKPGDVSVRWRESLDDTRQRMWEQGVSSARDLEPNPLEAEYADAYEDVLAQWWEVRRSGNLLLVSKGNFPEPCGFSGKEKARAVRNVVNMTGACLMRGDVGAMSERTGVLVTPEHDYTRVLVRPWIGRPPWSEEVLSHAYTTVQEALDKVWHTDSWESVNGLVIKVRKPRESP